MLKQRLIIYGALSFVILISFVFFYEGEDISTEEVKPIVTSTQKIEKEEKTIIQDYGMSDIKEEPIKIVSSKVIEKEKMEEIEELEEEIKKEKEDTILTSFSTDKGRYSVSIVSDIKLTTNESSIQYIAFRGEFVSEQNTSKFNFSLDNKYTGYNNTLKLLIDDITTQQQNDYECDGYFLSGLSSENIYKINIDISNQSANCYISDTIALPEKTKLLLKKIENLTIDENGKFKF